MCRAMLHDTARDLGLGALHERHSGGGGSRGLFDDQSDDGAATAVAGTVVALRAFESAGVSVGEVIAHYPETPSGGTAGYAPPLPAAAAVGVSDDEPG